MTRACAILAAAATLTGGAQAQSLFHQPAQATVDLDAEPAATLYGVSLYVIRPPEPRSFQENDLITIIVSESVRMKRLQTLETEKDYEHRITAIQFDALKRFLTLQGPLPGDPLSANPVVRNRANFEGDGEYERRDDVTARVTARVLEVKPNGTLLIEARTTVTTDNETQTITLSGLCRTEDVTERNTVQSNQLFDLQLNVQHEGELKKVNQKGLIPRVLETIFNF